MNKFQEIVNIKKCTRTRRILSVVVASLLTAVQQTTIKLETHIFLQLSTDIKEYLQNRLWGVYRTVFMM
jgi:hypothetical protein